MSEVIQVLIVNYNKKAKNYELGRQEILEMSLDEFKKLIQEIPESTKYHEQFQPRIITEDYIFIKEREDTFQYKYNYKKWLFIIEGKWKFKQFKIEELQNGFMNWEKERKSLRFTSRAKALLNRYMLLFTMLMFLIILITEFPSFYAKFGNNIYFWVLYLWIFGLTLYIIIINFKSGGKRSFQKIPLKYSLPIVNIFETTDISSISVWIFDMLGTTVLFITLFPEYLSDFLVLIVVAILIVLFFMILVVQEYMSVKKIKLSSIQFLHDFLQREESLTGESKQYYLQLILELEKKPIFKLNTLSKSLVVLTIIISLIPYLL